VESINFKQCLKNKGKKMLSENLLQKLNEQVTREFYASNLYLQMSAWCNHNGLNGSAKFLRDHAADEMSHMHKIFAYIQDTGALALIDTIEKNIPTPKRDVEKDFLLNLRMLLSRAEGVNAPLKLFMKCFLGS